MRCPTQRASIALRSGTNIVEHANRITGGRVLLNGWPGLARENRVTARAVTELLTFMHRHPQAKAFRNSLAVAGRDGTIRNRMKDVEGLVLAHVQPGNYDLICLPIKLSNRADGAPVASGRARADQKTLTPIPRSADAGIRPPLRSGRVHGPRASGRRSTTAWRGESDSA